MTKKQWNVNVADKLHIVEVEGGTWSFTGKLKVDDHTVKVWRQWLLLPKEVEFEVGQGRDCRPLAVKVRLAQLKAE